MLAEVRVWVSDQCHQEDIGKWLNVSEITLDAEYSAHYDPHSAAIGFVGRQTQYLDGEATIT
jgi:hypothetical protein